MKLLALALLISISSSAQTGSRNVPAAETGLLSIPVSVAKPKQDTAMYILLGRIENFQLLYKAVKTPDDITRGQAKMLADWIDRVSKIVADTTKHK